MKIITAVAAKAVKNTEIYTLDKGGLHVMIEQ